MDDDAVDVVKKKKLKGDMYECRTERNERSLTMILELKEEFATDKQVDALELKLLADVEKELSVSPEYRSALDFFPIARELIKNNHGLAHAAGLLDAAIDPEENTVYCQSENEARLLSPDESDEANLSVIDEVAKNQKDSMPRHLALVTDKVTGEDLVMKVEWEFDKKGRINCVILNRLDYKPSASEAAIIQQTIEAQGGLARHHGIFRYDMDLASQNLVNCPYCNNIWKARGERPLKCQKCQKPLPKLAPSSAQEGGVCAVRRRI